MTLDIGGRIFGSYTLKVNESQDILPFEVPDGLRIGSLTYEDIHGNKITESDIVPITIITDFGFL